MGYGFGSIDELGEGYGFRKVRKPLGVTAFGVNAIVYPPGYEGFHHFHDTQDELYFVHAGTARIEVDGEERVLGPGGLCHVESTTPRKVSNASEAEDLVLLVVGGSGGYVERDGHMVDEADIARRTAFGSARLRPDRAEHEVARQKPWVEPAVAAAHVAQPDVLEAPEQVPQRVRGEHVQVRGIVLGRAPAEEAESALEPERVRDRAHERSRPA